MARALGEVARPSPASERWRSLAAVIACVSIYGVTTGLSLPLLSLILESRGVDRSTIGLVAAMPSLAIIIVAPLLPRLVAAVGMRPFMFICIIGDAALFLLLKSFDSVAAWLLLRALMGFTVAGLFIASETWINEIATDDARGRIVGLYNTVFSGTLALGPLIIPLTGIDGWAPFLVGAGFVLVAALPLAWVGDAEPVLGGRSSFGIMRFVFLAPTLSAAIALVAFKETAGMALLPVYGVSSGLSQGQSALMLSVMGFGALCMQLPIGWLADSFDRYRVLLLCGVGGVAGALLLPVAIDAGAWLWGLLFLWGGSFAGLYTVTMTMVGQRFRGAELVTANAAFGLLWGVASLVATPAAGAAMDAWNPHGLVAAIVTGGVAFLLVCLWRRTMPAR